VDPRAALVAALIAAALWAPGLSALERAPIVGRVTEVRDGDTIEVDGRPIRLQGLAAPELRQPLGREASRFLRRLTLGRQVSCEPDGTRTYDRAVAVCRLDGRDLAAILVARGLARDCRRYSLGRYAAAEQAARQAGAAITRLYRLPGYCR
jgi:endonuclease YncB( thermonuclease family)